MVWKPDYMTLDQAKGFLGLADNVDDDEIQDFITAASRAIDKATGRQFGKVSAPEIREYTAYWNRHKQANLAVIDDLQDLTGLEIFEEDGTTAITDYKFYPVNALSKGDVYEEIKVPSCGTFTITASWGWNAVPVAIRAACKLQVNRFMARRDSPYGVAGSPEAGSEVRLLARLDPDVAVSLRDYERNWWVA
jgi:hypothetical protein